MRHNLGQHLGDIEPSYGRYLIPEIKKVEGEGTRATARVTQTVEDDHRRIVLGLRSYHDRFL